MIYDKETLSKFTLTKLQYMELELIEDLKSCQEYWLESYHDNEGWAHKVKVNVNCLEQVREAIITEEGILS